MTHPLETTDFTPRAKLLDIIGDLEGRLTQCAIWLHDALEALEHEADMESVHGEDQPNSALEALSAIRGEMERSGFIVDINIKR